MTDTDNTNLATKHKDFFESSYKYGGLISCVLDPEKEFHGERVIDVLGAKDTASALQRYIKDNLEVVLTYDILGHPPKNDFLGAHFIRGYFQKITEDTIIFKGPKGRTALGVELEGSAYDITPRNLIDVISVRMYNKMYPHICSMAKEYDFSILYGPSMGVVTGQDAMDAFMSLSQNTPSMIADRKVGYTIPVRLDKILTIPKDEKIDIKVDKSEFSKDIRVDGYRGSGTGTGW
jgi:hypothetical protein